MTRAPVQNPAYVLLPGLFLGLSLGLGLDKQTNAGKKKPGKQTAITRQSHAVTREGRKEAVSNAILRLLQINGTLIDCSFDLDLAGITLVTFEFDQIVS